MRISNTVPHIHFDEYMDGHKRMVIPKYVRGYKFNNDNIEQYAWKRGSIVYVFFASCNLFVKYSYSMHCYLEVTEKDFHKFLDIVREYYE